MFILLPELLTSGHRTIATRCALETAGGVSLLPTPGNSPANLAVTEEEGIDVRALTEDKNTPRLRKNTEVTSGRSAATS